MQVEGEKRREGEGREEKRRKGGEDVIEIDVNEKGGFLPKFFFSLSILLPLVHAFPSFLFLLFLFGQRYKHILPFFSIWGENDKNTVQGYSFTSFLQSCHSTFHFGRGDWKSCC